MSSNQTEGTIAEVLEKIAFIATALGSATVEAAWWATSWFDFGPEVAKYIGNRVSRWWRRRGLANDVKDLIDQLRTRLILDSEQVTMLKQLVDAVRQDDGSFKKKIATKDSLQTICEEYLAVHGFDKEKASIALSSIIEGIREVLIVSVTPVDMYREQIVTKEQALKMLRDQTRVLQEVSKIGLVIPDSFTPLHRRLEYDVIIDAFDKHLRGQEVKLPEPMLFRRPHPNWIDLAEDHVFFRDDLVERIESNFKETNMQLVMGESGAGKTTLSFIIGYRRFTDFKGVRHAVYYLDFLDHNTESIDADIRFILNRIVECKSLENDSISRVLLIFDNVHLNPKCLRSVYEKMRCSRSSGQDIATPIVDFLFLARPIGEDLHTAEEEMVLSITGSKSAGGLLQTLALEKTDFHRAVIGICKCYLDSLLDEVDIDLNLLAGRVARKSRWSLWLVSFVLSSVENIRREKFFIPEDFKDINICGSFTSYYLDQLYNLEANRDYERLSRRLPGIEDSRKVFWSFLILLSIFNRSDFGLPERIIHSVLSNCENIRYDMELLNCIRDLLLKRGEIIRIGRENSLSLPHQTLAFQMFLCAQNSQDNKDSIMQFDPSITSEEPYRWCELLLEQKASIALMADALCALLSVSMPGEHLEALLDWCFEKHELLVRIVKEDRLAFQLFVGAAIFHNRDATIEFVTELLSQDDFPIHHISSIGKWTSGYRLLATPNVRDVIFSRFKREKRILFGLSGASVTELKDDKEFLEIVENRIPDIAEELQHSDRFLDDIDICSSWQPLHQSSEIERVIQCRLEEIKDELQSPQKAPRAIGVLSGWNSLIENEEIRVLVIQNIPTLTELIAAEQGWIIRIVGSVRYLSSDKRIIDAIVELISNTDRCLKLISFVLESDEFVKNEDINKIIEMRIPKIVDSLKIIEIHEILFALRTLKHLIQNVEVQNALEYRIPELLEIVNHADVSILALGLANAVNSLIRNESLGEAIQKAGRKFRDVSDEKTHEMF